MRWLPILALVLILLPLIAAVIKWGSAYVLSGLKIQLTGVLIGSAVLGLLLLLFLPSLKARIPSVLFVVAVLFGFIVAAIGEAFLFLDLLGCC